MGASFVEKIAFARGWARPSSRRSHLLEDGRVVRREDRICSRMGASFVEKIAFARGWARPSSRRSHLLEDGRVLRREDCICSRMGASFVEHLSFAGNSWHPIGFLRDLVLLWPAIGRFSVHSMRFG